MYMLKLNPKNNVLTIVTRQMLECVIKAIKLNLSRHFRQGDSSLDTDIINSVRNSLTSMLFSPSSASVDARSLSR